MGRVVATTGLMALLAAGCELPRTELVVRVDSELPWGDGQMVQSVVLTVRRGGHTGPLRSVRSTALGGGREQLPLSVGLIAADDDTDTPVWIEALGCSGPNGCATEDARVAQRALVRFVRGETVELPLLLAAACAGVSCAGDRRCAPTTGQCEAATRAQEEVRPFDGIDVSPETDAAVQSDVVVSADEPVGGDDVQTIDAGADVVAVDDQGVSTDRDATSDVTSDDAMDAGAVDVVMDVGVDAGPPDAGVVDVALVDVGVTDTGLVDVEQVDMGPIGSDVRDAGGFDTGDTGRFITCGSGSTTTTCAGRYACCVNLDPPMDGGSIPLASLCGCQVRAGPTVLFCAPGSIASCE